MTTRNPSHTPLRCWTKHEHVHSLHSLTTRRCQVLNALHGVVARASRCAAKTKTFLWGVGTRGGTRGGKERALQLAHLVKMETNTHVMEPSMSPETLVRVGRSLFSIKRPQELHGGPWHWHCPMDCKPRRNAMTGRAPRWDIPNL